MDCLRKGWFTEFSPDDLERMKKEGSSDSNLSNSDGVIMGGAWPGQAFSLKVKEVLFHEKSDYQDVLVFKSESYGNVLVLDGIIQATERDEFSYQEMLAHLPMFAHPNPKKVLIIGGGDGGILREVLKHPEVDHVTMCEIDRVVIEASKRFLPRMSCCFSNPKLNLYCGDGFEFLKNHKNEFDVIITDSSDPIGPAENLFGKSYYELLRDSLNENGVLSSQGECPWLDLALIAKVCHEYCSPIFPVVRYAVGSVPTYTSGFIGYIICSKFKNLDVTTPSRTLTEDDIARMNLRYYNSQVHSAAFVLPQFVRKAVEKK
ncbi:Putrescine aminopropyltransferase [Trichostrongylus colubriformis]|uniref:Spermidine synthase n=1 Tax=Trichostrongylus colubriformis TaxID=6319 RepID=A0AAN8F7Y4_TRICO